MIKYYKDDSLEAVFALFNTADEGENPDWKFVSKVDFVCIKKYFKKP